MASIATLYRSIAKNPSGMSSPADFEYLRAGIVHLRRNHSASLYAPSLDTLLNYILESAKEFIKRSAVPSSISASLDL